MNNLYTAPFKKEQKIMTNRTLYIKNLLHNNRHWSIVLIGDSYFARCFGQGDTASQSDTEPYSTADQAEEFITMVKAT